MILPNSWLVLVCVTTFQQNPRAWLGYYLYHFNTVAYVRQWAAHNFGLSSVGNVFV